MITSFPSRALFNPGGLSAFYFIPYYSVASIPDVYKGRTVAPLQLKPKLAFHKGYATQESLKFTEKTTKTDNGPYYPQDLQGFYPGDSDEAQHLFADMEQLGKQFFVIFEDHLGRKRLAGYAGALEFSADYDSENKRYSFSFSGNALEKAPVYPFPVIF